MRNRHLLLLVAAGLASLSALAHADQILDRTITISADRVTAHTVRGVTSVAARGGMVETRAGRPALPWISERVDLPDGMRIANVEVLDVRVSPIADAVRVPSAAVPRPGLEPDALTPEDPRWFH